LSAIRDDEGIILKHFTDSLIVSHFECLQWKLLDLWTGWGFPWIPLKIYFWDQLDITLVDSVWKKINACNEFIENLNLENIKAIDTRAEELAQNSNYREQFDYVTSRAVAYLPTVLEYTLPFVKVWWYFIAYKLDNPEELAEWEKALKELGAKIEKIETYKIWKDTRKLIFIKKIKSTPKKYPRGNGEPKKKPII
jgi:16S rRNA (guanine527-N7)-methyltransferase